MRSEAKTASKASVNFGSRSRIKNLPCLMRSAKSMSRLRACWVTHAPVGLVVTPRMWTRAAGNLDHKQHVQTPEQHRVDVEEVAGQDPLGLRGQELPPAQARAAGRPVDARPREQQ